MKKLFLFLLIMVVGCASIGENFPETGRFLSDYIPGLKTEEAYHVADADNLFYSNLDEYRIGRGVGAVLLGMYKPIEAQKKQEYVSKIGLSIARFSDRPELYKGYRFVVVQNDEINAMATPSGMIFVTSGLFDLINDEDTLAAVMAHEVSHVVKRHGIKSLAADQSTSSTMSGGKVVAALDCSGASQILTTAFSAIVADIVTTLIEKGYSREQEFEADNEAALILERAGYNPDALKRLFKLLIQAKKDGGGWFSTHPSPEDRIEALNLPENLDVVVSSEKNRIDRFNAYFN